MLIIFRNTRQCWGEGVSGQGKEKKTRLVMKKMWENKGKPYGKIWRTDPATQVDRTKNKTKPDPQLEKQSRDSGGMPPKNEKKKKERRATRGDSRGGRGDTSEVSRVKLLGTTTTRGTPAKFCQRGRGKIGPGSGPSSGVRSREKSVPKVQKNCPARLL